MRLLLLSLQPQTPKNDIYVEDQKTIKGKMLVYQKEHFYKSVQASK